MSRGSTRVSISRSLIRRSAAAGLCLAALASVASTYNVFSQTFDESVHIAAGMQWLTYGLYTYEPMHPLVGRVAVALGPWLDGLRSLDHSFSWTEGNALLYARDYSRTLTLARLGTLPFLAVLVWVVWGWARRLHGETGALFAVFLLCSTSTVLAHAGLATNDVAITATLTGFFLSVARWLETPSAMRAVLLGLTAALSVVTKFSALPYGVAGALSIAILWLVAMIRRGRGRELRNVAASYARTGMLALIVAVLGIWLPYGFSVATIRGIPIPIPQEIEAGILQLWQRNGTDIPEIVARGYINGEWILGRIWYYFIVAATVKTQLPVLLLAAVGVGLAIVAFWRNHRWEPLALVAVIAAILVETLPSRIHVGVRHVLPIYPLLAILAAHGAQVLWSARVGRGRTSRWPSVLVPLLFGWQAASVVAIHPDHLAYFNELAGPQHPRHVLLDSNIDWGQDLLRLSRALRERRAQSVAISYFGMADVRRHGLPNPTRMLPGDRPTGWVAISETPRHGGFVEGGAQAFRWLDAYEPAEHVGRSILLYYVPPR